MAPQPPQPFGQRASQKVSQQVSRAAPQVSQQASRRASQQASQQASQHSNKSGRRKWSHFEDNALVHSMVDMVNSGVYKSDNGFKPGYLNHLEEVLKISCPNSNIKAKPHIESHVKSLKKDWFVVHDIIHGLRHGSSGFGFDSTSNMIVASNDVWEDYLAKYPEAKPWCTKAFLHYENCCYIFRNDRATGEEARAVADALEEVDGHIDSSNENETEPIAPEDVDYTAGSRRSRSATPDITSIPKKKKKQTYDTYIGDSIITATQIIAEEISKANIGINAAITADRDMRQLVVAAMDVVPDVSEVDKAMYGSKIMARPELMEAFLALQPPFRLAWFEKMFPNLI